MTAPDGTFHLFSPLYHNGSLSAPFTTKHGVAQVITGPYDWTVYEDLPLPNENPAACAFVDPATGKKVYTLWSGGKVYTADSPASKFVVVAGFTYPGGNPAPLYHNGSWYMTNQETDTVYTTPRLVAGARWTVFSTISKAALPTNEYHVECVYFAARPMSPRARACRERDPALITPLHPNALSYLLPPTPPPPLPNLKGTPLCGLTPAATGTLLIMRTATWSSPTAGRVQ